VRNVHRLPVELVPIRHSLEDEHARSPLNMQEARHHASNTVVRVNIAVLVRVHNPRLRGLVLELCEKVLGPPGNRQYRLTFSVRPLHDAIFPPVSTRMPLGSSFGATPDEARLHGREETGGEIRGKPEGRSEVQVEEGLKDLGCPYPVRAGTDLSPW